MDRIRLLYIDYSDWHRDEFRSEGHTLSDQTADDQALWPTVLYALDDRDRCLTAAYHARRLRVVASEATGVSVLFDTPISPEYAGCQTDASAWMFPSDRFDQSLLSSEERCWCGCAFVKVRFRTVCLRCKRTDTPYAKATTIRDGVETDLELSVNVGGKRIDLPAGYPLHWRIGDSDGMTTLVIHYEGMDVLARPAHNGRNFEALSWSRSDYWCGSAEENSDGPLEECAVQLACLSQWRERIEFDHLRCDACFRLRCDEFGPCCHCGNTPDEQPQRENFLPAGEKIRIIHIGECDHLSMWFRELIDVDGNVYRLYHRGGKMYAFRVDDEFILFDRKQGGPFDGAGNNKEILRQTSDVFEVVRRGTKCNFCGTVYPDEQVPMNCYVCELPVRI